MEEALRFSREINNIKKIASTDKKIIAVIAPIYNENNLADGYFQRIKTIDQTILKDYYKVYFHIQEDYTAPLEDNIFYVKNIDEEHSEIYLDPRIASHNEFLYEYLLKCSCAYVHCALRAIYRSTGDALRRALCSKELDFIWDVHGSVPEEFALYNDYWGSQEASEAEAFLAKNATVYICVNNAMKNHLLEKYGTNICGKCVILPIFNKTIQEIEYEESEKTLAENEIPTTIYAGGLQKWQCIDHMQDIISSASNYSNYIMCVSNPQEFNQLWNDRKMPQSMIVEEAPYDKLVSYYKKCHYGFIIRENSVVNRVACPTKLIEYIQFGIIPIMNSTQIGDFSELGLSYITGEDFAKGKLPSEKERQQSARENTKILKRLLEQNTDGMGVLNQELDKIIIRMSKIKHNKELKEKIIRHLNLFSRTAVAIYYSGKMNDCIEEFFTTYRNEKNDCFVLSDTLDVSLIEKEIGVQKIFAYCGINIRERQYGSGKEPLIQFCNRNNITKIKVENSYLGVEEFCRLKFDEK